MRSTKKTPSIPWDSEEFSQVIWLKQSFNFTFNSTENSLALDRIRVHTSKAPLPPPPKKIKQDGKGLYNRKYNTYQWPKYLKRKFPLNWSILYMRCSHRSLLSALNHCLWISTRVQPIQNRNDDTTIWDSLLWKSYLWSVQMPSTIEYMMPWLWSVQCTGRNFKNP